MTIDDFLTKFDQQTPAGQGFNVMCPAHDDNRSSLNVAEGDDGRILLKCYADCSTEAVLAALGLGWPDLFPGGVTNYNEPEAVYSYTDEVGNELYQAVRFPGKNFKQRHYDPASDDADENGWVWSIRDVPRRVLYRLPEVKVGIEAGRTIWVCEGEKDAEALRERGYVATCNPMGAGKWRPEFADQLAGANVIIIADRDEPGRNHADAIKRSLEGRARGIWVMQAKAGKDAYDHLVVHGLEPQQFVLRRERIRQGIVTARELADAGKEMLNITEKEMPGFQFSPVLPIEFRLGRIYVIGAYTSDGKTRFGLQGFRHLAERGVHIGYFTLEMPEADLRNILVAHRGVPLHWTEHPWLLQQQPELLAQYNEALGEIATWDADIIFKSGMNADYITEVTRDREYDVIVIDHLHRFSWGDRRNLEEQVQKLTNLALDNNVCVVLLCQLRRQMRGKDMEAFPEPTISDFKETSVIEQESSMALSIWRQRTNGLQFTGTTKVSVLKNRHRSGPHDAAGKAYYPVFDPEREMFMEGSETDGTATHDRPGPGTDEKPDNTWD